MTPGATPVSSATAIVTPGTGQNQTPGATPAPSNNQNTQPGSPADNGFPYMYLVLGLSSIAVIGFLFIPGYIILRKRLLPTPVKSLPPSGAAPWKRTRTDNLQQQGNMSGSPFAATGNNQFIPQAGSFAAPGSFAPNPFNAMSTVPNVSAANWNLSPNTGGFAPTNNSFNGPISPNTSGLAPAFDPFNRQASPNTSSFAPTFDPFNGPISPNTSGLAPASDPFNGQVSLNNSDIRRVEEVADYHQQPAPYANNTAPTNWPATNSAPGIDPFAGIGHSIDSSPPTIRKRLRRNELYATGAQPVGDQEMVRDFSADVAQLSDPYLRSLIQQYSDKERATRLPPEG